MLLGHMEESCPHSLNQERDSIKRHLFKCATECRKSLTNTYRQENKHSLRVSVRTIGRHEIQVLAQVVQRKKLMIFLNFNLQLNMRSSWFSQMDQPDGFFFFLTYAVEFRDKTLSQRLRFSLLQSTGEKGIWVKPTRVYTKQYGS